MNISNKQGFLWTAAFFVPLIIFIRTDVVWLAAAWPFILFGGAALLAKLRGEELGFEGAHFLELTIMLLVMVGVISINIGIADVFHLPFGALQFLSVLELFLLLYFWVKKYGPKRK